MKTNGKIAVAVAGGYLLGRTKKAKLAIGLGMLLAGKKINLDPQQLAKSLADTPLLSGLNDQVRKELFDAAKSAATRALTNRANSLADTLHERTLSLRGGEDEERAEDEGPEDEERAEDEGPEDEERAEDEGAGEEREPKAKAKPKPRRKAAGEAAAKAPASRARKTASSSGSRARKAAKSARTAGGRNG